VISKDTATPKNVSALSRKTLISETLQQLEQVMVIIIKLHGRVLH